jgi:hypothetical protein
MKLSTREDIDAPIAEVFAAVSDFDSIEKRLRQRGVSVERDAVAPPAGAGRRWQAVASWRGRQHRILAELIEVDEGQGFAIESASGGVVCLSVVDLVALSKTRTRMLVSLDLRPTTLSSRLLIQSLRLAKGRLSERLSARAAEFARRIEAGSA